MRKIFFSVLAVFSMGTIANAQFSVFDKDDNVLFTMEETPTYVDFVYNGKVWNYNSEANLWKSANISLEEIFHADAGWNTYSEGSYTYSLTNASVSLSLNQSTAAQWQAQYKINTGITGLDPTKKYNFHCKFAANKGMNGITVKICELGPNDAVGSMGIKYENNTMLYAEKSIKLEAGKDVEYSATDLQGIRLQDNPLMFVFDFGGSPENFEVTITDIIFEEVAE